MEPDKDYLSMLIKGLVDHPEDVEITRTLDNLGVLLAVTVHPEDMGKVIGKDGNIAKAIRTLLKVVGMKQNARLNFKINEPVGGKRFGEFNETKSVDEVVDGLG
jgi:uncharacterized protein